MLKEIAMLAVSSNRTKAYLQLMAQHDVLPSYCVILHHSASDLYKEASSYQPKDPVYEYFSPEEPILRTLQENNVPFEILETDNINDPQIPPVLEAMKQSYIVYAGFGGQILKKQILSVGKKLLHIHPGIVPSYKGSTTLYFSLLNEKSCGATAIFLEEKIDTGPIIAMRKFEIPTNVPDMDHIFDPFIRASLLVDVLKSYKKTGIFPEDEQDPLAGETYYIIHPVLKHIAMLSEVEPKRGGNK